MNQQAVNKRAMRRAMKLAHGAAHRKWHGLSHLPLSSITLRWAKLNQIGYCDIELLKMRKLEMWYDKKRLAFRAHIGSKLGLQNYVNVNVNGRGNWACFSNLGDGQRFRAFAENHVFVSTLRRSLIGILRWKRWARTWKRKSPTIYPLFTTLLSILLGIFGHFWLEPKLADSSSFWCCNQRLQGNVQGDALVKLDFGEPIDLD